MHQPDRRPINIPLDTEEFAGWPGTVGAERLERAINYMRNNMSMSDEQANSGDPNLDHDIFMIANSLASPHLGILIDFSVLDNSTSSQWLYDLIAILRSIETETHFACATLAVEKTEAHLEDDATINITHVFTMAKDMDWMGLCITLPHIKDLHIHAIQSPNDPQEPCAMIAVPTEMVGDALPPPPPTPVGGLARLETITRWHGAQTFHWSAATDATAP